MSYFAILSPHAKPKEKKNYYSSSIKLRAVTKLTRKASPLGHGFMPLEVDKGNRQDVKHQQSNILNCVVRATTKYSGLETRPLGLSLISGRQTVEQTLVQRRRKDGLFTWEMLRETSLVKEHEADFKGLQRTLAAHAFVRSLSHSFIQPICVRWLLFAKCYAWC